MTSSAPAFNIATATRDERAWELMRLLSHDGQYDEKQALALVAAGLNTEIETEQEDRLLIKAAFTGREAVAKALIAAHAKLDAQDIIGMTALMGASSGGHTGIFDALVGAGAKLGLVDEFGEGAYYMAAEFGKEDILGRLIRLNVPLDTPNKDGKTPRAAAFAKGHHGAVKMIDAAIFARDLPLRQEQARQQALLNVVDRFRGGLKVAKIAPEQATFRPKSAR